MATAKNNDEGMVTYNGVRYRPEDAKAKGIKVDEEVTKTAEAPAAEDKAVKSTTTTTRKKPE